MTNFKQISSDSKLFFQLLGEEINCLNAIVIKHKTFKSRLRFGLVNRTVFATLLRDVKLSCEKPYMRSHKLKIDHFWIDGNKLFSFQRGQKVSFSAKVKSYRKFYYKTFVGFTLTDLKNIEAI